MTPYEFLDIRATLGERTVSMVKFWLTVTFAVFGAAHYLGNEIDGFSSSALFGFYTLVTLLCGSFINLQVRLVSALKRDAEKVLSNEVQEMESFSPQLIWGNQYKYQNLVVNVIFSAGLLAYGLYLSRQVF